MKCVAGIQGPGQANFADVPTIDVPACIKITCQQDMDELQAFLKKIVDEAIKHYEKERAALTR